MNKNRPLYLSYSGWQKYMECPAHYYLEYIAKERPEVEDGRNSLTGRVLHGLLEDYLGNKEDRPEWITENAEQSWEDAVAAEPFIGWKHQFDQEQMKEKTLRWAGELQKLIVEAKIKPADWKAEFKADTDINLGGHIVRMGGRIDLTRTKDNGEVIFFDLKCSENRAIMKLDQLTWYATLLGIAAGDQNKVVAGGYLLPGFGEIKMYRISEDDKKDLLNRLALAFDGIRNERFEPNLERKSCFFCNVPHVCPLRKSELPTASGIMTL